MNKKQRFDQRQREKGLRRVEEWIPEKEVTKFRGFARNLREAQS